VFSDTQTRQDIADDIVPVREAWQTVLLANNFPVDENDARRLYDDELAITDKHVNAHSSISRRSYWDAGTHSLTMTIETSRPKNRSSGRGTSS
jgi:hypothetical protein